MLRAWRYCYRCGRRFFLDYCIAVGVVIGLSVIYQSATTNDTGKARVLKEFWTIGPKEFFFFLDPGGTAESGTPRFGAFF